MLFVLADLLVLCQLQLVSCGYLGLPGVGHICHIASITGHRVTHLAQDIVQQIIPAERHNYVSLGARHSVASHQADSHHLLDPAVGQVEKVLALGAVPVTALLLPEVVAAVVVLDMAAI